MTLKIDHTTQTVNASSQTGGFDQLLCCFDVSKASLSLYTEYQPGNQPGTKPCQIEEQLPNQTGAIEQVLDRLEDLAKEAGLSGLRVLAEPTGGYERKLLQTARRLGHKTGLVSGEHVSKLKTVESNDTGKTDQKDPRVMHLIARLGKTQTDRHLPERYRQLRRLTRYYDEDEETLTAARQRIQAVIQDLFPDYDKSATFTFNSTGQALMDAYQFNPYHIARAGQARFKNTVKRRVNARYSTLEHLFERATESARYHKTETEVEILVSRLKALWADYTRLTARRTALRAQIEAIGEQLTAEGELPDLGHLKGITLFNLTRLASQTGPLTDQCPDYRRGSVPAGRFCATPASTSGSAKAAPIADKLDFRKRDVPCFAKFSDRRSSRSSARQCSTARTTIGSSRKAWSRQKPRSR